MNYLINPVQRVANAHGTPAPAEVACVAAAAVLFLKENEAKSNTLEQIAVELGEAEAPEASPELP